MQTQFGFTRKVRMTSAKSKRSKTVKSTPIEAYVPPLYSSPETLDDDILMPPPDTSPTPPSLNASSGKAKRAVASVTVQDSGAETPFRSVQLSGLGLVVQLNHRNSSCSNARSFMRDFTVIHTNGVHDVKIAYCGCKSHDRGNDHVSQLFRQRWMPATWNAPRTVFTFEVLNLFHVINLQSKCNLYDFYSTVTRQVNNADLMHLPNKYNEFSFAVRVWRHLKQLKRAGRVHDPQGVMNMPPGALSPKCPACPDPDRNLPDGWDKVLPENEWLYEKIFALDACFKLSLKNNGKKGSIDDPELASGYGVFVNEDEYQIFLKSVERVPEESGPTCGSQFHAVNDASMRSNPTTVTSGRKVTGVAGIKCARHAVVERVGDLAYGERFLWIDWIVLDALRNTKLKRVAFTYDIYCKWIIHFAERVRKYFPLDVSEPFLKLAIRGFVPKLHLYAHGSSCQTVWSLNYHKGVGRTDGESTERDWAAAVLAALQTAEMNPGARHAALDDHWMDRNFRRLVGLKDLLLKWLKNALKWSVIQRHAVEDLERGYDSHVICDWKNMVRAWEMDHKKPDPYEEPETNDSAKILRAEIKAADARRDVQAAKAGCPQPDMTSLRSFILTGTTLRQRQYDLKTWIKSKTKISSHDRIVLQNKRVTLQRDIYQWSIAQGEYMPHIKWARSQDDFSFSTIHGQPPPGDLTYINGPGQATPGQDPFTLSLLPHTFSSPTLPSLPQVSSIPHLQPGKRKRTHVDDPLIVDAEGGNSSFGPTNALMDVDHAEDIQLWLPSDIPRQSLLSVCSQAAVDAEVELLNTELHDSLVNLRKYRRLHCVIRSNYRGEYKAGSESATRTRKRKEITVAGEKIEVNKLRYQRAWTAAQALHPDGEFFTQYLKLEQKDIRGPNPQDDVTDLAATGGKGPRPRDLGTGTYQQSWIWRTVNASDDPVDQVRVQWAKANANAERWEEELILVSEEMRRTLASFEWQRRWWLQQIGLRDDLWTSQSLSLALNAYARRQADIFGERIRIFTRHWAPTLLNARLGSTWLNRYLIMATVHDAACTAVLRQQSSHGVTTEGRSTLSSISLFLPASDNPPFGADDICNTVENGFWNDPAPKSAIPNDDMRAVESDDADDESLQERGWDDLSDNDV